MFTYQNAVCLLTGATGGLGRRIARLLLAKGARLVLSARDQDALEGLSEALGEPERVALIPAQLEQEGAAVALARAAEERWGRVDVVINGAGLGYFSLVEELEEARLREVFEVNAFAPLLLARALLTGMKRRGDGRIVNVLAAAGRVPIPSVAAYGGAKTALALIGATLRFELAGSGVRVLNIYPSAAATGFEARALRENARPGVDPEQRFARDPDGIAAAIVAASCTERDEIWLERKGRRLALAAEIWPAHVRRRLRGLRDRVCAHVPGQKARAERRFEGCSVSAALSTSNWEALVPRLGEVAEITFDAAAAGFEGETLLARAEQARRAGCAVRLAIGSRRLDADLTERLLLFGLESVTVRESPGGSAGALALAAELVALRRGLRPELRLELGCGDLRGAAMRELVDRAAAAGVDRLMLTLPDATPEKMRRALERRRPRLLRRGRRLGVDVVLPGLESELRAVCSPDPRLTLVVDEEGAFAPCARLLAAGYGAGRLPEDDPLLVTSSGGHIARFEERARIHAEVMRAGALEGGISRFQRAAARARDEMPPLEPPCAGCPAMRSGASD